MCAMGNLGKLNRSGMDACLKGQFKDAELQLLAALELARKSGIRCTEIKIHNNLGIVHELQGDLEKALHHYGHALDLVKRKTGAAPNHPLRLRIIRSLARVGSMDPLSVRS